MAKFFTMWDPKPANPESFVLPSETIPDQSMTIPEIIARFVRSGVMPVKGHPDEGGNAPLEDVDPLDLQPDAAAQAFEDAKADFDKLNKPEPAPDPEPDPESPADSPRA